MKKRKISSNKKYLKNKVVKSNIQKRVKQKEQRLIKLTKEDEQLYKQFLETAEKEKTETLKREKKKKAIKPLPIKKQNFAELISLIKKPLKLKKKK